ncbi:MAG: translation elongation factor-like protein [Candidatus Heimdallarchaeota archaeon]|nr:translation elongation factor-like protein [Candidatus Heimdallarchaeota archaeon]
MLAEEKVGEVFKFFAEPSVAAINVSDEIKIGDEIQFLGATTCFKMKVKSMEIEGESVEKVTAGQKVGIKVPERVRPNDEVYRVTE